MNKQEQIREQIKTHPVVLYMKGSADFPQCGFSGRVVQILNQCEVDFVTFDVLSDPELRQAIKEFSNWPTIPQLYVNGEFMGGSDIVGELFKTGELQKKLREIK